MAERPLANMKITNIAKFEQQVFGAQSSYDESSFEEREIDMLS